MDLFINTSLNHISVRCRLVSQPNNKFISNNEKIFNAMALLPITCRIINSQIGPGSTDAYKNSKIRTTKISLDSGASAVILHKCHSII